MRLREYPVPMDYWWFRLPRTEGDPESGAAIFKRGAAVIALDRGDYFQLSYMIPKGSNTRLRREDLSSLRRAVADMLPWTKDRLDALRDWDDVKFLDCRLNRLHQWYADGLLCIGDAAHAMSPAGGTGINLAIQDAVAAARLLATPLRESLVSTRLLAKVQRRRQFPTKVTQLMQRIMHKDQMGPALSGKKDVQPPSWMRLMTRIGPLQRFPAQLIAIGVRPEHAPAFARRTD
jgi:2-polyprenyl-6-methoxyphenol hydroxylase-like FAD-dependent oxidoreductase